MKKILSAVFITTMLYFSSFSQEYWKYEMYDKIDHTNFRSQSIFQQAYNFNDPDIALFNAALYFLTNEQRVQNGKDPLKYSSVCEIAAYNHSKSMVEDDFFSHTNSNDKKRSFPSDRGKLAGGSNASFAENIAYNYPGENDTYLQAAETFIDQWMNSKGHRENILSPKAKEFGCGVYPSGDALYATQCYQWFSFLIKSNDAVDKLPPEKS